MKDELREFSTSPLPFPNESNPTCHSFRTVRYAVTGSLSNLPQRPAAAVKSQQQRSGEEDRRLLLQNDMSEAHRKGWRVCRLWQLLLALNLTIIVTACVLILLLLFIIGPLPPYQTHGQSCRTGPCDRAQGLICDTRFLCACPSPDSYWSSQESGCRVCPSGWSFLSGKCIFVSTFYLNWTEAFAHCKSSMAQLLTLSAPELYPSLTLSQISDLVSSGTNYFIGLSEQPNDSGNWQWVDGSSLLASSMNLFCANGSANQFNVLFRTYTTCGMYRMDSCLARSACQRVDSNFICEKI